MSKPLIEVLAEAEAVAPRVARAAHAEDLARQEVFAAIREAYASGLSLRTIAAAAGLSHERIRQIVSE